MKNILLRQLLVVSFGLAIGASVASAAAPGRNLQSAQARFFPPVTPGSQACVFPPVPPKRAQAVALAAGFPSKC